MKQLLSESARYNAWANAHLVSLFRSVDDELITQNVVSSFHYSQDFNPYLGCRKALARTIERQLA